MLNEEEIKRAFEQAMSIWVNPEIEIRKKKGWLKEDFILKIAQIIFTPNQKTKIKFNNQVKITAKVKLKRNVIKGEVIFHSDLETIEDINVNCPPNSGHITLILFLDRWIMVFDARYNKEKIMDFILASKEFYESAKENLEKNRLRPFFENCWASAELSSACHFLSLGQEYSNHRTNLEKFKEWSKLRNVDEKHSNALFRLNKLRKSARYLNSKEFEKENTIYFLDIVKLMLEDIDKLIR